MQNKTEKGRLGEDKATEYLENKGYMILDRNYRYKRSEVDIIASYDDLLVFVEVKLKSYTTFGQPEEAVNEAKANKVMEGAEQYTYDNDWQGDIRFDIISIVNNNGRYEVEHFEDAFY